MMGQPASLAVVVETFIRRPDLAYSGRFTENHNHKDTIIFRRANDAHLSHSRKLETHVSRVLAAARAEMVSSEHNTGG